MEYTDLTFRHHSVQDGLQLTDRNLHILEPTRPHLRKKLFSRSAELKNMQSTAVPLSDAQ